VSFVCRLMNGHARTSSRITHSSGLPLQTSRSFHRIDDFFLESCGLEGRRFPAASSHTQDIAGRDCMRFTGGINYFHTQWLQHQLQGLSHDHLATLYTILHIHPPNCPFHNTYITYNYTFLTILCSPFYQNHAEGLLLPCCPHRQGFFTSLSLPLLIALSAAATACGLSLPVTLLSLRPFGVGSKLCRLLLAIELAGLLLL